MWPRYASRREVLNMGLLLDWDFGAEGTLPQQEAVQTLFAIRRQKCEPSLLDEIHQKAFSDFDGVYPIIPALGCEHINFV